MNLSKDPSDRVIDALRRETREWQRKCDAQSRALAQYRMATDWLDAEPWMEKVTDPRIRLALSALSSSRKNYDGSTGLTTAADEEARDLDGNAVQIPATGPIMRDGTPADTEKFGVVVIDVAVTDCFPGHGVTIISQHYFTAADGYRGRYATSKGILLNPGPHELGLLTFCVLVLSNGFTVTGESACASPANFDAEREREEAKRNALSKIPQSVGPTEPDASAITLWVDAICGASGAPFGMVARGLAEWNGNQHNESWGWKRDQLAKLDENQLAELYASLKARK